MANFNTPHNAANFVGRRFERLVVKALAPEKQNGKRVWVCKCDCGNEVLVTSGHLNSGHTTSCGCWRAEAMGNATRKHGLSHLPEYAAWKAMKQRCRDPSFKYHEGKGVRVCSRWAKSFEAFYADMGPKPSSRHELDRYPDPYGDYKPSNCRWATRKQANSNKRGDGKWDRSGWGPKRYAKQKAIAAHASSQVSAKGRKRAAKAMRAALTPETLSRRAKTRWKNMSPKKRAEIIAKANAARLLA